MASEIFVLKLLLLILPQVKPTTDDVGDFFLRRSVVSSDIKLIRIFVGVCCGSKKRAYMQRLYIRPGSSGSY